MTLPDLESLDAQLDSTCSTVLGDSICYTPASIGGTLSVKAFVDHRDANRAFESAAVISQDMSVQIHISLIPSKPVEADRITIAKLGTQRFKPMNVRRDESGNYWEFELKAVNA